MGVPALFRWLSKKYPKIVSAVIEEHPHEVDGVQHPVDITKPNPNGEETDNLYLDFNGIVHPCTHPEDKPPPGTESEMMTDIFTYTERVVRMARPRKVLMIAVDGVAPRAKMNQQRARRFRAAKDAQEADEKKEEFNKLLQRQQSQNGESQESFEEAVIKKTWDTNQITPGTPFMNVLALSLRYWVQWKLNTDPAWEKLKVIISDATVPGEGEHKIMSFVRSQRTDPEYNPNTTHVIYGLDADLIMLGLATHEPYFKVLREDVFAQESKAQKCKLCGQQGHRAEACRGAAKEKNGEFDEKGKGGQPKPFIWLSVSTLREYLEAELYVPNQPFRFDLERAIDDWVFMCFFVGNDFLPHLPSLNIHEGGIDTLIAIWRDNIPSMGGYLTCDGSIELPKAQVILQGLAKQEDAIFRRRKESDDRAERNKQRRKQEEEARNKNNKRHRRGSPDYANGAPAMKGRADDRAPSHLNLMPAENLSVTYSMVVNPGSADRANAANKSAAAVLKERLMKKNSEEDQLQAIPTSSTVSTETPVTPSSASKKRKLDIDEDDNDTPGRDTPIAKGAVESKPESEVPEDTVRLWEPGYADRYYEQKFKVSPDDIEFRHKVARAYVEGLCWATLYYFQGCPSWTWYYPYHYAPFAADFVDIDKMEVKFETGTPFKPYEQLMGVLPAASNHAIPPAFHPLMTEPNSEIIDFYPEDFELDANGAKQPWKAVVLLPFIDEKRLLDAMATKYPELTADEHERNARGKDVLLISETHPLYEEIKNNFYSKKQGQPKMTLKMGIGHLAGKVERNESFLPHSSLMPPLDDIDLPQVDDDRSMSVHYEMPPALHVHKSMLLRGVKIPHTLLDKSELSVIRSRARNSGRSHGGVPLYNTDGPRNNYGRGPNRISYEANNGNGRANQGPNRSNPFAAHLDPNFRPPPVAGNQPMANSGHNQYQVPRYQQYSDSQSSGGYRSQSYGAPPPQQNDRYSGSYPGNFQQPSGNYGSSYRDDREDPRGGREGGRSFSDGYSRRQGPYDQGGYGNGGYQSNAYQGGRGGHNQYGNGYHR